MRRWYELPSPRKFALFIALAAALTVLFAAVYGSLGAIATRHPSPWRAYFDWELAIPFVPGMIYVYFSLLLLTSQTLFTLTESELVRYAMAFAAATLAAAPFFFFFPGIAGYARLAEVRGYEAIYRELYRLDPPHNVFPSLHIAYSSLSVLVMAPGRPRWFARLLWAWLALILASVLLVHQHHVFDIVTGFALALAVHRFVYLQGSADPGASP